MNPILFSSAVSLSRRTSAVDNPFLITLTPLLTSFFSSVAGRTFFFFFLHVFRSFLYFSTELISPLNPQAVQSTPSYCLILQTGHFRSFLYPRWPFLAGAFFT